MEIAALLAAGLSDWVCRHLIKIDQFGRHYTNSVQVDFGVICGILLLNAVVGWYQEKQAADVVLVSPPTHISMYLADMDP